MKILIPFLALLLCGFWVPGPNYDERRKAEIGWLFDQVGGEAQLTAFLVGVIDQQKIVDGVDLRKSKMGTKWVYYGTDPDRLLVYGDWILDHHGNYLDFGLTWTYAPGKAIELTVHIEKKGVLKLLSIKNDTDVITLCP